jgi:hypothetical protein
MVAIIKSSGSLRNVLHYNENKLKQNNAELIHSMNYGKDTEKLGFTDKIKTLEKLTSLNERTKLNAVHITLNFEPSEKLSKETLQKIADDYMKRIGFGDQPYLVYQHNDSGHPHVHIITTNIQHDGKRIRMQNIGRNQSEKARKEIEKDFRLVRAQKEQLKQAYELKPVNAQKVQYGKSETKRAITNVLDALLPNYKYASLAELNAVLKQYNVVADQGSEDSRTYKNGGLVYRVLDEKGQKVGAPVKASDIYNKPTLKTLKERFAQNQIEKQKHKAHIKNAIDFYFASNKKRSLDDLIKVLQQEKIQVVLRKNDEGKIYGITYVDHQTKCVFNGSDLGKQYSANQMQERCERRVSQKHEQLPSQKPTTTATTSKEELPYQSTLKIEAETLPKNSLEINMGMIKELVRADHEGYLPGELTREQIRKKKRKKRLHH